MIGLGSPLLALLWVMLLAGPLAAQELARPRLEGRVLKGQEDTVGVASATVVLHLVTPDVAGEIDTVRAGPNGEFSFDLPAIPDPVGRGDVYFASVDHDGILYFGPPVHQADQLAVPYLIEVHDTIVAPAGGAELAGLVRFVFLFPDPQGWFVTDLFQLENEGDRTIVASEGGIVWSYPLPLDAWDIQLGGDAPADAVDFEDGVLRVFAPIAPGVRQFMIRYRLADLRLDLPLPGVVQQIELLVQEPSPALAVQGLMQNQPTEMQPGVTYRRFSGLDVRDTRVLVLPGSVRRIFSVQWLAVGMSFVLALSALWAVQRFPASARAGSAESSPTPAAPWAGAVSPASLREQRERILLEIALIDERLESETLVERERAALLETRAELVERIRGLG